MCVRATLDLKTMISCGSMPFTSTRASTGRMTGSNSFISEYLPVSNSVRISGLIVLDLPPPTRRSLKAASKRSNISNDFVSLPQVSVRSGSSPDIMVATNLHTILHITSVVVGATDRQVVGVAYLWLTRVYISPYFSAPDSSRRYLGRKH